MTDRTTVPNWVAERPGISILAAASSLLALFVFLPYLQYILFGIVLAYSTFPLYHRLEQSLKPTSAAIVVVTTTVLVVLLPLVYIIVTAVEQSFRLVRAIRHGQPSGEAVDELLATIEVNLERNGYEADLVGLYEANQHRIASALQDIIREVMTVVGDLPSLFIGLTVTLFVFVALLRDGEQLVAWLQWVVPIDDEIVAQLRTGLDQLMWASIVGNVAVAAIQSVMLGLGLAVAGVPAVVFLTVATFVLTLLPLVGAFGIWIPAAVYLVAMGKPAASAAIVVYGLLVTFSDTYLRPALIGRTSAFNSAIVVVGIFGGLIVFGAIGLFIGPVVLGGAKLTLDAFARVHTGEALAGKRPQTGEKTSRSDGTLQDSQ